MEILAGMKKMILKFEVYFEWRNQKMKIQSLGWRMMQVLQFFMLEWDS
jgi:hypothetical protein